MRLSRDERGVTAVVAVICLLAIFGAATLSVDAGNAWQTRRNMVTATDAAALAEAQNFAETGAAGGSFNSCTGLYSTILDRNAGTDVYDRSCTVVPYTTPGTGYITVEGYKPVDVRFGVVLGLDDTAAYSMSAAMVGFVTSAKGVRPIGICNQNRHVQDWIDLKDDTISQAEYDALKGIGDVDGDLRIDYPISSAPGRPSGRSYASYGVVHRIYFNHQQDDGACGTFPGNVGWLSFDGLPADTGDRAEWLLDGYDDDVAIRLDGDPACEGQPGSGDADDSAAGCLPADSGGAAPANPVTDALDAILDKPIYISIFDTGACEGGGVTCTMDSWAFLGVILRGYKVTGAQEDRYFDFEFVNIQISGKCCAAVPGNQDMGARGVKLCAVDHDAIAITDANRCGAVQN